MDTQPNSASNINPSPLNKRPIYIFVLILTILAAVIAGGAYFGKSYYPDKQSIQLTKSVQISPIPSQAAVSLKTQTHIGFITSITSDSLTIQPEATGSAKISFLLSETSDIEKLISGTTKDTGVKLEKSSTSDLNIGQRVSVIANNKLEAITVIMW